MIPFRRNFGVFVLLSGCAVAIASADGQPASAPILATPHDSTSLKSDPRLHLTFGPERVILPLGLQPSLICTSTGTLIVQGQLPSKPLPSKRITYPYALSTVVSRDQGLTWTPFSYGEKENGLDLEGGAVQFRDKTILALDTYITPGEKADHGIGLLYTSTDDWATLSVPREVDVLLPDSDFHASTDDGGHPHAAQRAHRRIIELPGGALLATLYGFTHEDHEPCPYQPKMMKSRVILIRSDDRGLHWREASSIVLRPAPDTEGFGEPTVVRVSSGPHAGRLICVMRTGRNLMQAISDDDAKTWTPPTTLIFADRDVTRSELWVDQFRSFKDFHGKLLDESNPLEIQGAVVDPDLIELRSGVLVACFGVRVPQKLCWAHPEHPWNGNYLAFSLDHGETWSGVTQVTSGVLTTHYMAIAETPTDNELYVTYDLGGWSKGMQREIVGRTLRLEIVGSGKP